ncbi:MAG: flagellar basal body P-ring formation chaperone FlgA [Paracoccaceae bacterium]|jgi:flagella basal body P-ring formation protein FlgA
MWLRIGILLALSTSAAMADSVVAVRTLPAQTVVQEGDVALVDAEIDGALTEIGPALGQEVKITVYAGRPLRPSDLGTPTLVERNQIVNLVYMSGTLTILADGRALTRGAEGDVIRVMNLASKTTVSGRIAPDGRILVGDLN